MIVLDSRQPGMLHFEDVMQAGSSQHVQQLQDLQKMISFDDPINIQFTSVTVNSAAGGHLRCCLSQLSHFHLGVSEGQLQFL